MMRTCRAVSSCYTGGSQLLRRNGALTPHCNLMPPPQVNRRTLQYKHTRIAALLQQHDRWGGA